MKKSFVPVLALKVTTAYGRERRVELTETQVAEWLEDLGIYIDERMSLPFAASGGNGACDRLAFSAPEVIRGKIAQEFCEAKLACLPVGTAGNSRKEAK